MAEELETVRCHVIRETVAAYLLRDHDDQSRETYFPKSLVSFSRRNIKTGEATADIPLWLLNAKGWNS